MNKLDVTWPNSLNIHPLYGCLLYYLVKYAVIGNEYLLWDQLNKMLNLKFLFYLKYVHKTHYIEWLKHKATLKEKLSIINI